MKSIILLFLIVGIIFISVGYVRDNIKCPPPVVEYRYIPKTFNEQQNEQVPVSSIFGTMFTDASPWQNTSGYQSNFNFNNIVN